MGAVALAVVSGRATLPDLVVFVLASMIVLSGAVGVIFSHNPVHSALMLVMTLFGIAILFVELGAHFLAVVQVIVYAGAIVILFLFVIMLLGVDKQDLMDNDPLPGQRPAAFAVGILIFAEVLLLARVGRWTTGGVQVSGDRAANGDGSNVEKLARLIFTRYLFAFEVTSVLLIIAVVGAVVLARRPGRVVTPNPEPVGVASEGVGH